jgi:uncharacterized repeat protein (TIGR01451 family)
MRNGRRKGGLFGLLRLAPVMVGGFVAALMIGGAATGALLTSSEGSTDAPPPLTTDATTASTTDATTTDGSAPGDNPAAAAAADDAPDLTIAKTATPKVVVGGDIVYVVTVKNVGTAPALNILVNDTLPAGVKHDTSTIEAPTAGACSVIEQDVRCTLPELAAGATATITIEVIAEESGTLRNTASVLWQGVEVPKSADASTVVDPEGTVDETVDLALDKSAPATAVVGATFAYTLRVDNLGRISMTSRSRTPSRPASASWVRTTTARSSRASSPVTSAPSRPTTSRPPPSTSRRPPSGLRQPRRRFP